MSRVPVLFLCLIAAAQTPPAPVPGWHLAGNNAKAYEVGLDRSVVHGGVSSASIHCREGKCEGFGTLMQQIRADRYLGARIVLAAWVKADHTKRASLWMRVDGQDTRTLQFDNMQTRWGKGTFDWVQQQIVLDVPETAAMIYFGLIQEGGGQAWVDDAALGVVSKKYKTTNTMMGEGPPQGNAQAAIRQYRAAADEPANLDFEAAGTAQLR